MNGIMIKPAYILVAVVVFIICTILIRTPKSKERAKAFHEELNKKREEQTRRKIKTYDDEYDHDDYDSTGPIDDIHDDGSPI